MIKLENYDILGWEHAIRGMRNPMNSWEKSDSHSCGTCGELFEEWVEDRTQMNYSLKFPNEEKVQFGNSGLTKSFDICPGCTNTIQSTIDHLSKSNRVNIGCDSCKFGPVNAVDYMRCHKCSSSYNLWEAKD